MKTSTAPLRCPGCQLGLVSEEPRLRHPECEGTGLNLKALRSRHGLGPHAFNMLRVIAGKTTAEGRCWVPGPKSEFLRDEFPPQDVFIDGGGTVSAIKGLTRRGLVEEAGARMNEPYARRITEAGRALLVVILTDWCRS